MRLRQRKKIQEMLWSASIVKIAPSLLGACFAFSELINCFLINNKLFAHFLGLGIFSPPRNPLLTYALYGYIIPNRGHMSIISRV
jgi:hypothetical protein